MQATRKSADRSAQKSITKLYADFEHAVAKSKALPPLPKGVLTDPRFDKAVDRCSKIAWHIVKAPANDIDEMMLKIAVAGWCMGAHHKKNLSELDRWQPQKLFATEEAYALVSLRDDLRRMRNEVPAARAVIPAIAGRSRDHRAGLASQ